MVTHLDIVEFANDPINEIELGMCDRNAYRFHIRFQDYGALIHKGLASSYRDGVLNRIGDHHYWNSVELRGDNGEISLCMVDIYSLKSDRIFEYRDHIREKNLSAFELENEMELTKKIVELGAKAITD